jgi:hypothetical protein
VWIYRDAVATLLPRANRAPDNLSRFGVGNRMYLSLQALSVILSLMFAVKNSDAESRLRLAESK